MPYLACPKYGLITSVGADRRLEVVIQMQPQPQPHKSVP